MNLYFISAPDPSGKDDRLDAFVYEASEFTAYQLWRGDEKVRERIPDHVATPNYDLYLLPHDPMLPQRGIGGLIPWSLDDGDVRGVNGSGVVQLVSSSWTNYGPTTRADGGVWDSAAGVWRKPNDPSDEVGTIFAVEALISAAATGEPVDPAVMALARSALATLKNVLDDGSAGEIDPGPQ